MSLRSVRGQEPRSALTAPPTFVSNRRAATNYRNGLQRVAQDR